MIKNRRKFIKTSLVGTAGLLSVPAVFEISELNTSELEIKLK